MKNEKRITNKKYLFVPSVLNLLVSAVFYDVHNFSKFWGYGMGALLGLFFVFTWFLIIERIEEASSDKLVAMMALFFPLKLVLFGIFAFVLQSYIGFDRNLFSISFVVGLFINVHIEIFALWRIK